jgi:ADP-dependent NAD(P)H-hydrate dehydratase / NAD(P)H-hydrate epimerase
VLELLTPDEMSKADKAAVRLGVTTASLMEGAGAAVAAAIRVRFSPCPVLVLCGAGNNGGDGYVAARRLAEAGWPVRVAALAPASGPATGAAARWSGPMEPVTEALAGEGGMVIDALFGAGLSRPLTGVCAHLAAAFPAERVVAVDLPSGVHGDGRLIGPAFSAGLTVTFARKKPAHVLYPARARCGDIVLADIGMPDAAIAEIGAMAWENQPGLWRDAFPWPSNQTHKHQRGSVGVASGGPLRTGAARLAARGALRAGAGLVTVLSPPNAALVNAAHLTAIMLETFADEADLAARAAAFDAFVLGPAFGLGESTQRAVFTVVGTRKPLVLDADALTAFKDQPERLFAHLHDQCLLTPHEGEFGRLFPDLTADTDTKLERARKASARAGCPILLKGPDTVIAAPDGRAAVNTNAPPFLATAGAGDVLAGIAAGLAAQGMEMWSAGCAAVWLHAEAANVFGPGLIAEDLCEALPRALAALHRT